MSDVEDTTRRRRMRAAAYACVRHKRFARDELRHVYKKRVYVLRDAPF